jgi:hypothetical protein
MPDNSLAQFATTFLVAFAAYHMIHVVRALGFVPERWKDRKPIVCDLCMSFWAALVIAAVLYLLEFCSAPASAGWRAQLANASRHLIRFAGAAGFCYFLLRHSPPPASLPPL